MKKIPTIFQRNWNGDRSRVVDETHPDCGWVFDGLGVATRKFDGTCCLIEGGVLFKRHEVKKGKDAPASFVFADYDDETGKTVGWLPVGEGPEDRWHREAWSALFFAPPDGTYELLGPKVQGNVERRPEHVLEPHAQAEVYENVPRTFDGLRDWLAGKDIEGLVFHHPDGRMGKIKLRDFGLKRQSA